MGQTMTDRDEMILRKLRNLSAEKKREAIDFIEFLELRERTKKWVEFDEWAVNLAKERGFDRLTEDDVGRIVSDIRDHSCPK
jgi:hypothetical protein